MPYVNAETRADLGPHLDALVSKINDPGALNYAMTRLALGMVARRGKSYAAYNAVVGVFHAASQEFYRRHVAPYEDDKRAVNGDVA